jgi:hypothetical protein
VACHSVAVSSQRAQRLRNLCSHPPWHAPTNAHPSARFRGRNIAGLRFVSPGEPCYGNSVAWRCQAGITACRRHALLLARISDSCWQVSSWALAARRERILPRPADDDQPCRPGRCRCFSGWLSSGPGCLCRNPAWAAICVRSSRRSGLWLVMTRSDVDPLVCDRNRALISRTASCSSGGTNPVFG